MDNVDINRSIYVTFRLCLKHLARYLYKSSNELYLLTSYVLYACPYYLDILLILNSNLVIKWN